MRSATRNATVNTGIGRVNRPSWDEYFLNIAKAVSARADCRRSKVGAVLVKDNRIVATGYNGAPAGHRGCLDGHCPRGLESYDEVPADSDYSRNCIAIHAEANALLYADRDKCEGATLYVTRWPCPDCEKLIWGARVTRIVQESKSEWT